MSPNYDIDGKTVKNNKINSNNVPGPGTYDPTDIEERKRKKEFKVLKFLLLEIII